MTEFTMTPNPQACHLRPLALRESALNAAFFSASGLILSDEQQGTISVIGALTNGGYKFLHKALESMVDKNQVIISIHSPGGTVSGLFDLCDSIQERRKTQRIIALVESLGCSAGYALAASCSEILAGRSAVLGSVGIICMHIDQSGLDSKLGLKFTPIYAGARKLDGSSHFPLSPQVQRNLQQEINSEYDELCRVVAAGRGMSVREIQRTEAATYRGEDAVNAGLADVVVSFPFKSDSTVSQPKPVISAANKPESFTAAWQSIKKVDGCSSSAAMSKAARQFPDLYEAHATGRTYNQTTPGVDAPKTFEAVWKAIKKEDDCDTRTAMSKAARKYPDLYERHASGFAAINPAPPKRDSLPRPPKGDPAPRPPKGLRVDKKTVDLLKTMSGQEQVGFATALVENNNSRETWDAIKTAGGIELVKSVGRKIYA